MLKPVTEFLDAAGAHVLLRRIERYWLDRGYAGFKGKVQKLSFAKPGETEADHHIFVVRSNLQTNGFPPRVAL